MMDDEMMDDEAADSKMVVNKTEDRIIFKNNGFAFRPEDWDRLKRIADGNPDEQKVNFLFNSYDYIKLPIHR